MTQRIDSLGDGIETVLDLGHDPPRIDYRIDGLTAVRITLLSPPTVVVLIEELRTRRQMMRMAAVLLFAADRMDQANFARNAISDAENVETICIGS